MDNNRRPGGIRNFIEYLPKAMKFYSLKNEHLARIIFIFVLAVNFIGQLYIYKMADTDFLISYPVDEAKLEEAIRNLGVLSIFSIVRDTVIYMISAFYLLAFIREARGDQTGMLNLPGQASRRMLPYLAAYLVVTVARNFGILFLVVPGIIIHIMFLFNTCLIIDGEAGFLQSFKKSSEITRGYRWQIFYIIALTFIIFTTINMFFGSMGSMMAGMAISSFITTVSHLVMLRLTALIYVGLYHKKRGQEQEADVQL